jgi:dolichol-phosphate mannosyltransferase
MGVLWLLTNTGWNLNLSKVIAAEVAMLNNFYWNDIWTFKKNGATHARSKLKEFLRFNLICTIGIGLSVALLDAQVYWFRINVYMANLIAIVLVSLWNFFLSAKYGWNASISIKPIHPKSSSGVATVS